MEEKEIHIRDYLRIINKRRYAIIVFAVILFLLATAVTFIMTPQYEASTQLLIEDLKPDSLSRDSQDNRRDPEFLATQYEVIKSKSVAYKVVDQLSLDTKYASYFTDISKDSSQKKSRIKTFITALKRLFGLGASETANTDHSDDIRALKDLIADVISENIEVIPVRLSRVVEVSFSTPDPILSSMIVNAIAKAYMDELLEIKLNIDSYKLKWMNEKADGERQKLERSEKALQQYMESNNIITIEGRIAETPERLSELSTQLVSAETKRKELESLYNQVKKVDIESAVVIPTIASNPSFASLRESILKAEQNIIELSKKYGKNHPAMIAATENLNGLKKLQQNEVKNIVETIKKDYELAKTNEENIKKSLEQTKTDATQLNEKSIQYNILKRDAETNRGLYDALTTKLKEQNITGEVQTVNVWVLEEAQPPKFPSKPNKKLNVLLGLIFGICGGIGFAFFIEYLDPTIKSLDEIEPHLGLPILGTVFLMKLKKKRIIDLMVENPNSAFAERYKAIRTAIMLSSADNAPKSVLITSAAPKDGKTTTAVNLSLAMVQFKHNVLLIDADLRNPQIHNLFGLDNTEGLSSYAAGLNQGDIIKVGPLPNLHIITSGPIPPNPSEIISSKRIRELIEEMSKKYDMIIFDSAPSLHVTDSLILSKYVEGTILVVRAGKTNYAMIRNCIKSLRDINSRLLGVIFNGLDVKETGYYRYYGDYGKYYTTPDK